MPQALLILLLSALFIALPQQFAFGQVRLVDEVLLKPSTVHSVVELPDGGFVIASDTTHVGNALAESSLLRFTAELDPMQGWGPTIDDARALALDVAAQWLYVGGGFDTINGIARPRLARLGLSGQLDAWQLAPDAGESLPGLIEKLAVLPNGDLLAVHRPGASEVRVLLQVDAVTGAYDVLHQFNHAVFDIQLLGDGSVLVGGAFDGVNGSGRRGLVKLSAGTLAVDTTFASRPAVSGYWSSFHVNDIALNSAGDVFIASWYWVYRLAADGSTDYSFGPIYQTANVEQVVFDSQDRAYVLAGWPTSLVSAPHPTVSGLRRFANPEDRTEDPSFASPEILGRGARLALVGNRLLLLGSLRTPGVSTIGAVALSAETGTPSGDFSSLGTSEGIRMFGAVPTDSGGALVFGEFTHTPADDRLWGTLRLNAQGQRLGGSFMNFIGTPDSFTLTGTGELVYTSSVRPMPRPQDWGSQSPEGTWHLGKVDLSDGTQILDPFEPHGSGSILKSGVAAYGPGLVVAGRNHLRTVSSSPDLPQTQITLPFGTSRKIAMGADGFVVIDRGPPPPNAFGDSPGGGIGFWPPPPSSAVHLLYRWMPSPLAAVGLGPTRTSALAELGGFDVETATSVIYASFPGQTSAEPVWSIRRFDPAGAPEGEVLSTLSDHWASGGLSVDASGHYVYLGGFGPADGEGSRSPRVFRVSTADGSIDPEWPAHGGDAVRTRWIYSFGDQIFALSGTASGTYAAFYRTDYVLFENGFEQDTKVD